MVFTAANFSAQSSRLVCFNVVFVSWQLEEMVAEQLARVERVSLAESGTLKYSTNINLFFSMFQFYPAYWDLLQLRSVPREVARCELVFWKFSFFFPLLAIRLVKLSIRFF